MKKFFILLFSFCLLISFTNGCDTAGSNHCIEDTELIVFAAASLQDTLLEIGDSYMQDCPNIRLTFNFESSGTLSTQIQEGAACDLFISASPKQMDSLNITERIHLLENKVALAVPEENPADIYSFKDLLFGLEDETVFLAMGNSDVPVGQYTYKIFTYFNLDEEALSSSGCITYGSNVKEITTQISASVVDCGIVYVTDALADNLAIVDIATEEMCGQVIYPAAVLNTSIHPDEAQAFLDYLSSKTASEIFEAAGFIPLL